jgi:hypothetical protein
VKGVKFMWDACFESLKQIEETKGSGCILAHCMGLGKTFQVRKFAALPSDNLMYCIRITRNVQHHRTGSYVVFCYALFCFGTSTRRHVTERLAE